MTERKTPLLLLVDDDASLRLMLRTTLQAAGFDTAEADNCASGWKQFEALKPDLILLDVLMPDGNGFDLCQQLRNTHEGRDLPIVLVTGLNDLNSINQAYQAGATDFITKPINWGVMGYRMRYILRGAQIYRDLLRSEGKTRALLQALPDLIFRLSADGRYIDFQAGAQNPYLDMARSFVGQTVEQSHPADVAPVLREALTHALSSHELQHREFGLSVRNERHFWEARIAALGDNEAVAILRNITRRKSIESQLQLWATVFENSREAIFITDAKGLILSVNHAFEIISGYTQAESVGRDPKFQGAGKHSAEFWQQMWTCLAERDYWQGEVWNRRRNGDLYPMWMSISVVRDSQSQISHYIAVASDLSDIKEQQARIDFLSNRDLLTGLPNRHLFHENMQDALTQAKAQQQRCAVLFIDLDRFQNINDSLGHAIGDQLIVEMGVRLTNAVGDSEQLCRNGGDEFTVMLGNCGSNDELSKRVELLQHALAQPVVLDGNLLSISASIGISVYPDDGNDVDRLTRAADTALGVAKDNGRNLYQFFRADMNARAMEKLTLENQLRRALEHNELVLYYQPQIDAQSGRCIGAEALIRWRSPERGLVAPGKFIPLAEECGLIIPIGEWTVAEATRELAGWMQEGLPPITIAVNISAVQFAQKKFLQQMQDLLESGGMSGPLLELELTESMVMRDIDQTIQLLAQLKQLGFQLAIDDFGTGYSSLSYLRRLPIDVLKVDQSFVYAMNSDAASLAIVQTVMTLTKTLGLRSIAEGVETMQQAEQLTSLGCDTLQGYVFAKPMPADQFRQWLRQHSLQHP